MEACCARRAEMDFVWGSCLMTVSRRLIRGRDATGAAAAAVAGQLAQDVNPEPPTYG